ncbi:MAG: hypothetical protein ACHQHN_05940 [Sphingobacteriales bacterium]
MKTYIRLPFIAIALCLLMAACKGNNSATAADSTKVLDSSSTTKVDSTVKHDTSKIGIRMGDSDTTKKVDTIKKTSVKTTEVKKTSTRKGQ